MKNVKIAIIQKLWTNVGKQSCLVEAASLFCVCGQQAFARYHSDLCVITPQSHKWALSMALPAAWSRDMEMNIDVFLSRAQVDCQ